jgi:uncharacterized membrane protein
MFVGNMSIGPVWLMLAIRTGDIKTVRFALRLIGITDVALSVPGIALLVINGFFMSSTWEGGIYYNLWIRDSLILLGIMIIFSVTVVIYYQEKLYKVANAEETISSNFQRVMQLWSIWGTFVMIPPLIVLYLMVVKTSLW